MTERGMLVMAAKAGGIEGEYESWTGQGFKEGIRQILNGSKCLRPWNPRGDGGDAMRLAAKLRLDIEHGSPLDNSRYVRVSRCGIEMVRELVIVVEEFEDESGRFDAMCFAITRAAAAIGEQMP